MHPDLGLDRMPMYIADHGIREPLLPLQGVIIGDDGNAEAVAAKGQERRRVRTL